MSSSTWTRSDDYGDDSALAHLVNAEEPDSVKATVREGSVFLTGWVSSSTQRAAAEDTVAGVAGVLGITDEIEILGHT